MRLISYKTPWGWRSGTLVGDWVVDSEAAAEHGGLTSERDYRWTGNREILGAGSAARASLQDAAEQLASMDIGEPGGVVQPLDGVRLGPPILEPRKVICLGLNYRDHAEESGMALPEAPMLFPKFSNSLIGCRDEIVLPSVSEAVDYEAELAVVIGVPGKDVDRDQALEHVAGVMALNDVTARDLQHATSQWTAGKAIDTFAPCGPALVTLDEVGDLSDLTVEARVNGETVQSGHTSQMIFGVAETIAFLTRTMSLEVGDIIATGTPAGVGFTREPPLLLVDGDVVEVEIGGVGKLVNPVVAGVTAEPAPAAG